MIHQSWKEVRLERSEFRSVGRVEVWIHSRRLHLAIPEIPEDIIRTHRRDEEECRTDQECHTQEYENSLLWQLGVQDFFCQPNVHGRGEDKHCGIDLNAVGNHSVESKHHRDEDGCGEEYSGV